MWRKRNGYISVFASLVSELQPIKIENESLLEELITKDISILNDGWLLIGHYLRTGFDKLSDVLAVDAYKALARTIYDRSQHL